MTNNKKRLSIITHNMSEHDRSEYLKTKTIYIIKNDSLRFELTDEEYLKNKEINKTKAKKELRSFGETLCIFRKYSNIGDTNLVAYFSKNNLYESISKTSNIPEMYYVLYNINSLLEYSIKIEEHTDNKNDDNNKLTHELLAILEYKEQEYSIIKITIKELKYDSNIIYSLSSIEIIKKKDDGHLQMFDCNQTLETGQPLSKISLSYLVKCVNNSDILRYMPNEMLSDNQIRIKEEGIKRYNEKKKYQINIK